MKTFRVDEGSDRSWYAVDSVGCIAVFTVNSTGPIPTAYCELSRAEMIELDSFVESLPVRSDILLKASWIRQFSIREGAQQLAADARGGWIDYAAAGLFAYDYSGNSKPFEYRQKFTPLTPLNLTVLSEQLQTLFERLRLPDIAFATTERIPQEHFGQEVGPRGTILP